MPEQDSRNTLQANLSLPRRLGKTQRAHQVLPSGTTTLLPADILKKLLPLVDKDLKVAAVVFILVGGLQVSREIHNLGCEDSCLNLGRTSVGSNTRNFFKVVGRGLFLHTGRLGW